MNQTGIADDRALTVHWRRPMINRAPVAKLSTIGTGDVARQTSKANRIPVRNIYPALLTVTQLINITLEFNMKNIRKSLWSGLAAILVTVGLLSTNASAQTPTPLSLVKFKAALQIVNLEASPVWFNQGQRIDFVVTLKLNVSPGVYADGVDVSVWHKNGATPVAFKENQRLNPGLNTFRMTNADFRGDPGAYRVKVVYRSAHVTHRDFATRKKIVTWYTIDPAAPFPPGLPFGR